MIRKYVNSEIGAISLNGNENEFFNLMDKAFIIQAEAISANIVLVEFINKEEIIDLIPFTTNFSTPKTEPKGDAHKVEEYRAVEIRNDPFRKYSGCTLGDIFDAKDEKWIDRCVLQMKNDYIKSRVEYLKEYYGL